jgi:uncharacterized protein with HXXEE motif
MSVEHWLKTILLAGLVAALAVAGWTMRDNSEPNAWIFWLIWPAMAIHQCEENIFTELVLGKAGRFTDWVRTVGYDISPWRALSLNAGIGWTMAIAAGFAGEHLPVIPLFVAVVEAMNGFWHLSVTSLTRRWSPGTLSGVSIAVPLAVFLVYQCLKAGAVSPLATFLVFLLACASHHAFLISLPRIHS